MAMLSYDEAIHIANVQYTLVKSQNIVPFLDMALRFPEYAKENICLLMVQDPEEVTEFRTQREWLECGTHQKSKYSVRIRCQPNRPAAFFTAAKRRKGISCSDSDTGTRTG